MHTDKALKKQNLFGSLIRNTAALSLLWLLLPASLSAQTQPVPPRSGIEFASAEVRALQADDFANPGMLWVTRGEKLWTAPAGRNGQSCASCHQPAAAGMKGVAARYPRVDATTSKVVNLEGRINRCRSERQQADVLAFESEELLSLTAYVAHQSRGLPLQPAAKEEQAALQRGREIFHRRQGQMNLACIHCHVQNAGRKLLADTISEGHGNAYPVYRLEWQAVGSLQRRLRACYFGVRAEQPAFGSEELLDLELYLARRGAGLKVETPGVRR